MGPKRFAMWVIGGNLVFLLATYAPYALKLVSQYYDSALINFCQIVLNLIMGIASLIAPESRKYAFAWWASFAVVILASNPVCLASMSMASVHKA